ncbi:PQQ-binding-like beta-propeller repeat protein [Paenibacillus sp. P96]|uniref:PQQ-binding-like beta-propeller repeat protein n=1 Tax=Paenibacillus zeirhizosphaerae TaxID=2987519 RepID=A0ABT9FV26_9BACL|nr:PQQ-binding-like beta-propeller repeat protein [Paenibacillus sp. P96]MDP4098560.1 PQQ-binding-like beta-propeller repeat protein [Paenibacillus sp. P96]
MKLKKWKLWTSAALTAVLLTGYQAGVTDAAIAEETATKLSQPAFWTSPALVGTNGQNGVEQTAERNVHAVPRQRLVYVHTRQAVSVEQDMTGYLDILQAFDDQTGELKWQYELHKEKGPYTESAQLMYTGSGIVYIYAQYTDGTARIHAISPTGTETWSLEVAGGSKVSLISSSKLLVYKEGEPSWDGSVSTTITQYSTEGKLISQSLLNGTVIAAEADRIVMNVDRKVQVDEQWRDAPHPSIKILDDSLSVLDSYTFPSDMRIYTDGDPVVMLSDGSVLVRAASDVQQGGMLLGFDADGEKKWERHIPEGAIVEPAVSGNYVVYANGKLETYNVFNKMLERTFTYDPSGPASIKLTEDGNLQLVLGSSVYTLDPLTQKTIKLFELEHLGSPFDMTEKAVFSAVNNQLLKGLIR